MPGIFLTGRADRNVTVIARIFVYAVARQYFRAVVLVEALLLLLLLRRWVWLA
ncbi:hypothetical protein CAter10_1060 [Collimonas arenae]|nr:hypothetical protein CAter10_1060 [Collimonas arenae]